MASCSTVILWPWCVGIVDGPFQTEARRERTIPVPIARGFSLLLSPSLALAPTIHSYNPHHSFSFSLTLPDSLSHFLLPQTHAYALSFFLFRISMQIRYTFPLTESLLYVSSRNIPIYPFFLRSRTVFRYPRPLFLIPSLSLAHLSTISVHLDIKPQIHPFSSVRVHPHKVLFVLCPRISQSRLLSSFFSFRRLSILLLLCLSLFLCLPSHLRYVSTYYLREFPHRVNRPMISLAFHKSQPISDERFLLWIFKSFLCVHTFSTCTYEVLCTERQQYVLCAPV